MRILIVDDHEVVRRGVSTLLSQQAGWEVCGEAVDGQDAVEKAGDLRPDVIVMDVSMPRLNGLEATRKVRGIVPECEVVVLSQHDNREMARQALKAGAHGYVVKSSIARDLLLAIVKASRHEYFFDPAILDQLASPHMDVHEILQRSAAFEKALQESEQRLRNLSEYQSAVMNNMAEGLYAVDANGILTSINRAGEAILGWKKDELLGKKMHDLTHYKYPDGRPYPASECPGLKVVQNGSMLREHEDVFIRKDGSLVPVVFSASPLRDEGKISGVIVSFRDDTEQRQAREALLEAQREREISTNHLQLVTNFMAAFVTRCSKDLRYLWVSPACAEWLHRPSDEVIGKPIVEVLGKAAFDKLQPYFKRVLSGERVSYEEEVVYENVGRRWIMETYTPTFDGNGSPDGWVAVLLDITERRQAEQAQREQVRRIAAAFSQSYSFLVLLEPDGTIIEANRAALDAAGRDTSVVGRKFWEPWFSPLPDEVARLKRVIARVAKGESVRDESYFCLPDGSLRVGDRTLSPVFDEDGKVVMIVAAGLDITERKQTEMEMTAWARQQKALFDLADELHRAGSMEEIFNAALNAILNALPCNRASILLCDEADVMRFRSWRGLSSAYRAAVDGHSAWKPGEKNPMPICIRDIQTADLSEPLKAVVKKEGIAALAFMPLVCNGSLIGKFMAYFNTPHDFTANEIDIGMTIARQLSFAIDRKRNDEALQRSKAQLAKEAALLKKLNQCSTRLWQMRSLREGVEEMLEAVITLLGADKGNVQLLDSEGRVLTLEAQRGFENDFLAFFREVSANDDTACGRVLRSRERIVIEDIAQDAGYAPYREIAQKAGYRAVASTPLIGTGGTLHGVLSAHFRSPHRPSDEELARLELYVRQAGDFIERCKQEDELREKEGHYRRVSQELDDEVHSRTLELERRNAELIKMSEEARTLSRQLFEAQDQERRKIARNLHDSAGQTLAFLGMTLYQMIEAAKNYPEVTKVAKQVEESVRHLEREIRTASYLLHPPLLDESGLVSAIRLYLDGLRTRSELEIALSVSDDFQRLPQDLELVLFRLVQECVTNIHKHAGCKTASVRLASEQESVVVEIRDDGNGIPAEKLEEIQNGGSGLGIRGMRERVQQFLGSFFLESSESGTRVLATIPVPKDLIANRRESWEAAV